jgi:putative aldouronate transport system permease protein
MKVPQMIQREEKMSRNTGKLSDIRKNFRREKYLYVMAAIGFAWVLVFHYFPIYGIIIAFKAYNPMLGIWGSKWVGFKYFQMFFDNPFFWRIIRNTFVLGFLNMIWNFWPPILLALLFNELKNTTFKRITQSISYFPNFISTVIIVSLVTQFFSVSGIVNQIRDIFGAEKDIAFLFDGSWFRALYVGSSIWQGLGAGTIIYLATISSVNLELYSSAVIDGASRFQRAWYITLPSILPTVMLMLIFSATGIISVSFEKVFLMYSPATYDVADVISTYTYRLGIQQGMISYGSAIGLLNSAVAAVFLIVTNYISRRATNYSLW